MYKIIVKQSRHSTEKKRRDSSHGPFCSIENSPLGNGEKREQPSHVLGHGQVMILDMEMGNTVQAWLRHQERYLSTVFERKSHSETIIFKL